MKMTMIWPILTLVRSHFTPLYGWCRLGVHSSLESLEPNLQAQAPVSVDDPAGDSHRIEPNLDCCIRKLPLRKR